MIKYICVDTKEREINYAIQTIAKRAGYRWVNGQAMPYDSYPILCFAGKEIYHSGSLKNCVNTTHFEFEILSIEKIIEFLKGKTILIGDYEIFFEKGHLKIGCQTISNEKVREIWGKLV